MGVDFVDLHCHILPGIDDGAENVETAKYILETSAHKGVKSFIFTPHFYPERISVEEFIERRNRAVEEIQSIANDLEIKFRVGAEIQFTPVLASMPLGQLAFSGTQYLLLELFPLYEPHDVEGLIRRIRKAGYTPILAHIERFPYIAENPVLLYKWVRAGALAQVNAGWLQKDKHAQKILQQYFKWNLVHLMASDTHSPDVRTQNLVEGYSVLSKEIAEEFQKNARAIFQGESIEVKEPVKPVKRFGRWR